MNIKRCEDCKQYYPEEHLVNHKKHCKEPKIFESCSFCGKILEKKLLGKHKKDCEKNHKNARFKEQIVEPKFEKVVINHTPLPPEKKRRGRCGICEKNFPMAQSNICYECKDK